MKLLVSLFILALIPSQSFGLILETEVQQSVNQCLENLALDVIYQINPEGKKWQKYVEYLNGVKEDSDSNRIVFTFTPPDKVKPDVIRMSKGYDLTLSEDGFLSIKEIKHATLKFGSEMNADKYKTTGEIVLNEFIPYLSLNYGNKITIPGADSKIREVKKIELKNSSRSKVYFARTIEVSNRIFWTNFDYTQVYLNDGSRLKLDLKSYSTCVKSKLKL